MSGAPVCRLIAGLLSVSLCLSAGMAPATAETAIPFRLAEAMAPLSARTLAVVDFSNDTGETRFDNLKRGIPESLSTKLARYPELSLVERGQLDKAIKELGFAQSAFADSSKATQIGRMSGASTIVTGSLVKAGSKLEINVRMLEVETGKVVVSESYLFDSEDAILPVVNYLSLLIPQKLGLVVQERDLNTAREALRGVKIESSDNTWIYWAIGGGVLAIAAIVTGVVLVARANAKANEGPDIIIADPTRGGTIRLRAQDNLLQLPLLRF